VDKLSAQSFAAQLLAYGDSAYANPSEILDQLLKRVSADLSNPAVKEKASLERIDYVSGNLETALGCVC